MLDFSIFNNSKILWLPQTLNYFLSLHCTIYVLRLKKKRNLQVTHIFTRIKFVFRICVKERPEERRSGRENLYRGTSRKRGKNI